MGERYRRQLARVEHDAFTLATRTTAISSFRAERGRPFSGEVRESLISTAQRLTAVAGDLRYLAGPLPPRDEVGELVEAARRAGVDV